MNLDELGQRCVGCLCGGDRRELEALMADLPAEARGRDRAACGRRRELRSVFGDIQVAGGSPRRAGTVFGDVRVDLRGLRTADGPGRAAPEHGVRRRRRHRRRRGRRRADGWTLFGDRQIELGAGAPSAGHPAVVVHARTVFGDLRLRSLAPGESASRWGALMDGSPSGACRHRRRPMPPPLPPPPV